jgi:hypothetical protein
MGYLILIGSALVTALVYTGSCWLFPFARCVRCDGSGRRSRDDGKVWRLCRRCRGTGRRLRVGRRVSNYFAGKRRDAE